MTTTLPTTAILGAGSMGGAILAGLLAPDVTVRGGIRVTNRTEEKAAPLRSGTVTSLATGSAPGANLEAVEGAGIVLVAVKPAMVPDLLREIAPALDPSALVVSVAAGVTIATMESLVETAVLRAMPNTPSSVRRGVTGLSAGSRASDDDVAEMSALFGTVGEVLVVPESRIDALSTISGSGPAYVFYLIEELTRAATGLGFTDAEARLMVEHTFLGASELLLASGETPAELRRRVTSPRGTTEQAVGVLESAGLADLFGRASAAALARATELAAG
jgi:pyrroline-5-carboxylate reductase